MTALAETRQQAVAHLKFARVGPRKLRRVADAIRGKSVREAMIVLQFAGVFAAEPIEKLLKSAVANAENTQSVDVDRLFVKRAKVDGAGMAKRFMPRAQGRATSIRKRPRLLRSKRKRSRGSSRTATSLASAGRAFVISKVPPTTMSLNSVRMRSSSSADSGCFSRKRSSPAT